MLALNIHLFNFSLSASRIHIVERFSNLILSRQARFYATTEQKLINSFWNALRIRRKINQLYQTKFVLYIVYNSIYYTTQNNPLICWLSGTSENWRRTSRSCVTVVRRDKWIKSDSQTCRYNGHINFHWYKILGFLYKRALFDLQFVHNFFD
jgi:hypothetical protein